MLLNPRHSQFGAAPGHAVWVTFLPRAKQGPCAAPMGASNHSRHDGVRSDPAQGSEALARDRALLGRWRAGDSRAGAELLGHYRDHVLSLLRRLGPRNDDALADLFQEVMLAVVEKLGSVSHELHSSFGGWLAWQVRDRVSRYRTKDSGRPDRLASEPADAKFEDGLDLADAMRHCAEALPPGERQVFELRFVEGLDRAEIARRLRSNPNAIGQSLFRLSRRLRGCLEAQGIVDGRGGES